jgi:glutaredoxin-related protein
MKIIVYGGKFCSDTMDALALLSEYRGIGLDFRDITEDTATLKEFLAYRDHDPLFAPVKQAGGIGIPFFILEDGTKTFEIQDFLPGI